MRKTTETFKEEVFNLVGNEYIVLGEYINNNEKILMKHNKCNNTYLVRPRCFLSKDRCPICDINNRKFSKKDFINKLKENFKDEYILISDYKNYHNKLLLKHSKCGNKFWITPTNLFKPKLLKSFSRCPKCSKLNRFKTTETFKEEVFNLVGNEYIVLGEYKSCKSKILMKHNKCNNTYLVRPDNFINNNRRCPICSQSKGEEKITNYLNELCIDFKTQVTFSDCKYKEKLRFDFQLMTDDNIIILIEYDGEQHFNKTFYSNNLEEVKKRDMIKNKYCNSNSNIHLYRIKYTDYNNIENIIDKILLKEGSTTIES